MPEQLQFGHLLLREQGHEAATTRSFNPWAPWLPPVTRSTGPILRESKRAAGWRLRRLSRRNAGWNLLSARA